MVDLEDDLGVPLLQKGQAIGNRILALEVLLPPLGQEFIRLWNAGADRTYLPLAWLWLSKGSSPLASLSMYSVDGKPFPPWQ